VFAGSGRMIYIERLTPLIVASKTPMSKLRIALADDHALLRAGLSAVINAQPDMQVVAEAGTISETLEAVAKTKPDILALDLSMPGGSSVKAAETLRQQHPHTRILILTMHDDPAYLRATLAAGCVGYLVKTAADSELLSAFRAVGQGRTVINLPLSQSNVQEVIGTADAARPGHPGLANLSEREREVFALLAKGHTNQEIADKLYLSVKTIETYRARIGEKLGLRSRADMIKYAVEVGLLGSQ
jgi:two-component system response regulator NreC